MTHGSITERITSEEYNAMIAGNETTGLEEYYLGKVGKELM